MIRGGKGGGDPTMEKESIPLPVEAEEARVQIKWGQITGLVLGIVFLVVMALMAYTAVSTPGFPYLFPALAMAYFGAAGVSDLAVALTTQKGTVALWQEGKFVEGDERLRSWRMPLGFVPGGILPGWFLHRALERVRPLVQLEKGGVPAPRSPMTPNAAYSQAPTPYPAPAAGYAAPPAAYGQAPPAQADHVAPDPYGGARAAPAPAPAPQPAASQPSHPSALWSRPSTYQTARMSAQSATPRNCPSCYATLDADSRFCKQCGATAPA